MSTAMRRQAGVLALLATLALAAVPAAAAAEIQLTPVKRLSFPNRAYIVDVGSDADLTRERLRVLENGAAVDRFTIRPLASSRINSAVVLAVDASKSMQGQPYTSALAAVRAFTESRTGIEKIGIVAFNDETHVIQRPTASAEELGSALGRRQELALGTHIYDAVVSSVELLAKSRVRAGAVLVLSDGADVGSSHTLEDAVAAALSQRVRVFTVGLRTKSYDPLPLQTLAGATGGSYSEAASALELTGIYTTLGRRLASQYVLRYRSNAIPTSAVTVRVAIDGLGSAAADYTAPKPDAVAPFHRSLLKRFLLSPAATVVLSLLLALLVGGVLAMALVRSRSGLVGRVDEFLQGVRTPAEHLKATERRVGGALRTSSRTHGWIAKVERDLEIAGIGTSATRLLALTGVATLLVTVLVAVISPVLIPLGLLTPLLARSWVRRRLRTVRHGFADQLPPNLQVLASALRTGHSFSGALAVMVENASEPSHRELQRAVNDDRLGIPSDEALRRVADRMASRDLQQVALLSELQRTAGGNAAEVLDTVVETIRERADVRRLLRTLTAQGRMARWILTALPVAVAGLLTLIQPDIMRPLYTTTGGHVALLIAGLMVAAGSVVIQRIVDIEV
jgi:tight adherence protein B